MLSKACLMLLLLLLLIEACLTTIPEITRLIDGRPRCDGRAGGDIANVEAAVQLAGCVQRAVAAAATAAIEHLLRAVQ